MNVLNMCTPFIMCYPLCTQGMIEGGVNVTTMWEHEWEASTRPDPDVGPLSPYIVDAQAQGHLTQIKVPMTQRFRVDSSQVSRFIYLKLHLFLYYLFCNNLDSSIDFEIVVVQYGHLDDIFAA